MSRPRVLVVDDKQTILDLFRRFLEPGCDVETTTGVKLALDHLSAGEAFDVVVTDVRMPDANGFDLLRRIKEAWPRTQVVLMTAYASVPAAVEAMREGAYDYVQKPFDPDEVSLVVSRAAAVARGGDESQSSAQPSSAATPPEALTYREAVESARDAVSRRYLWSLLRESGGHVSRAARLAGMERESLHRLMRKYALRAVDFRKAAESDEG